MKKNVTIGVCCLGRTTYDVEAAAKIYEEQKKKFHEIPNVDWVIIEEIVISEQDALNAGHEFASKLVDGMVIISGTFHLGHLALILDREVQKPILLWAFNELPYNGGKIRLNSVCGVNLNSSNLYKSGNDCFDCIVADEIDQDWIDALRIKTAIKNAHVGISGYHAHGFFNLSVESLSLFQKTGILVDHYEQEELYRDAITDTYDAAKLFDCSGVTGDQVSKVNRLAASMEAFLKKNELDALAVRCWPEFANFYGIAPCAAMSILSAKGYTLACEGDLEGAVSLLASRAVCGTSPFLADFSQVFLKDDLALMWHCGVAPEDLWDGCSVKSLDTYFAGGRGVTADFVLKPGPITVFRIDSARGKTRLFLQKGEALETKKELKGTYCRVKFNRSVEEILDIVTSKGIAHHVVMAYGDYTRALRKFAKMMDFEVIE